MNNQVYTLITDKIIKQLEAGHVAWRKQWHVNNIPQNFATKRQYEGINFFLLSLIADIDHYRTANFLTYNQVCDLAKCLNCKKQYLNKHGAKCCANPQADKFVKKDEHGYPVIFWKIKEVEHKRRIINGDGIEELKIETDEFPLLRYYTVFNIDQCDGIKFEPNSNHNDPIAKAEALIKLYKDCPSLTFGGSRAYYKPSEDIIGLPQVNDFDDSNAYYSTLFHELTHSTGHPARLKRFDKDQTHSFGSEPYSKEELVAELGSAFLCATAGISTELKNQTAYIQGWLKALKEDDKLIIHASAQAQKSTKYIRGEVKHK